MCYVGGVVCLFISIMHGLVRVCVYVVRGSIHLRASMMSSLDRYGNISLNCCLPGGLGFCDIYIHIVYCV